MERGKEPSGQIKSAEKVLVCEEILKKLKQCRSPVHKKLIFYCNILYVMI